MSKLSDYPCRYYSKYTAIFPPKCNCCSCHTKWQEAEAKRGEELMKLADECASRP